MVMYGDYRRGSGGEQAYALRETIDIAKAGQPLPAGTVLVLEIFNNNALTDYFVMEKGVNWGLDFSEEVRNGDWHYQQYDPNLASAPHVDLRALHVVPRRAGKERFHVYA